METRLAVLLGCWKQLGVSGMCSPLSLAEAEAEAQRPDSEVRMNKGSLE